MWLVNDPECTSSAIVLVNHLWHQALKPEESIRAERVFKGNVCELLHLLFFFFFSFVYFFVHVYRSVRRHLKDKFLSLLCGLTT